VEQVEVTYTLGDMYAVTFQSWRRIVLKILILFGALIAAFIALPMITNGLTFRESAYWFPWDFYLGLVLFLLLFIFGACPPISYFRSKRQGFLGPNHIGLSSDGARLEGPKGQSLVYWSAVKHLVETKSRLFLFIGPSNAIVIPKRAFADQAGFEAAIGEAKAHLNASNA
jgi:hypothetical protein